MRLVYIGQTVMAGRLDFDEQSAIEELSIDDMEQVNGGILPLLLGLAVGGLVVEYLHHH